MTNPENHPAAAPPVCVPCQVAIWDAMAKAKLDAVTRMAEIKMQTPTSTAFPGGTWGWRWYETIERFCGEMDNLLAELTGVPQGAKEPK
jgi:hypothetical protein